MIISEDLFLFLHAYPRNKLINIMEDQENHKPHYRTLDDERLTADEMDEQRKRNIAYEYLCHLEEAKIDTQCD
ncbi:hypothetical protein RRG08_012542 [Elysia crispata]|uniref:Uncharacterized protein n=1 Tax=Elysia crispata TaxID=231223 RepID=A0AAE1ANZ5_9GAST|nr:hypothetical protein RRG08_012542 [Elysia crispata]